MTAPPQPAPSLPEMPPLAGVELAVARSGTGYADRADMLLARFADTTVAAGALTRNACAAAPVRWTRARLAEGARPRGLVFNAGNANCYTGPAGHAIVHRSAERAAARFGCRPEQVLVCSTGRIGDPLPAETVLAEIDAMAARLAPDPWHAAAAAMRTTDRWAKAAVRRPEIGGVPVALYGLTKGTAMLAPNMATTISFLFTDAALPAPVMQAALREAADGSYNCVSVDNTTSTNDSMLMFATGQGPSHPPVQTVDDPGFQPFRAALAEMLREMAMLLLDDARAGGKLVSIRVEGAVSIPSARRIARAVADSLMVRQALAVGDLVQDGMSSAGRILAAAGGAVEPVDPDGLTITLAGAPIVAQGAVLRDLAPELRRAIDAERIDLGIDVRVGGAGGDAWMVVPRQEG